MGRTKNQEIFPKEVYVQRFELDDTLDIPFEQYTAFHNNIGFELSKTKEEVFDGNATLYDNGEEVAIYKLVKIVKMNKKVSVQISETTL